jgi:hypothetical protein
MKTRLKPFNPRPPTIPVVLAGLGRSGTTWMANIINYKNEYRFIFEPFHPVWVERCEHFGHRRYIRPNSRDLQFLQPASIILTGKIGNGWTDKASGNPSSSKLLIKTIRANLFLKWLKVNFPTAIIVLAIRHPCAVVTSAMRHGWSPGLSELLQQKELANDFLEPFTEAIREATDMFEQHLFSWCIQYYVIFRQFQPDEIHLLFYENLYTKPEENMRRLFNYLGTDYDPQVMDAWARPSFVTGPKSRELITQGRSVDAWRAEISKQQLGKCIKILNIFGLDQIYTDASEPNEAAALEFMRHNL